MIHNSSDKGFSTLEVLISMAILVTALSAVIMVVFGNQTVTVDSEVNNAGLLKANEYIEEARASGAFDFNSLAYSSASDDIYSKELMVTEINPCRKNGIASISWATDPARPLRIELETIFTNPSEAVALGGDCGPEPPVSDWDNLNCAEADFDFSPAGLKSTGIDLINRNGEKYVLLTAEGSSEKDDLWVINVSPASWPTLVSSVNTGPTLNDVDGVGNYAFAANDDSSNQLQVIDISDLSNPVVVAQETLPGVGASYPEGRKIFYHNSRVYIGTWETAGNEFHVFDVSDPVNPAHLGSRQINHSIQDIFVRNEVIGGTTRTIAYLAVSVTSSTASELIVLDVTAPSAITQAGTFNAPGIQYGTAVYALGNRLYLGRETGGGHELFVLDVSDHGAIVSLGSAEMDLNPSTAAVRGIIVSGGLAFIATTDANSGFQVWDVTDPANIILRADCNYSEKAIGIDFDGIYIFAANESNHALRRIFDQP